MKAVVFAYSGMGIVGLKSLEACRIPILAVFTHEDDPSENRWFDSVAAWAENREIPVYRPENVNQPEWVAVLRRLAPDVIFSFYYRKILGRGILEIPPAGAFNLHGSLLPAYRGRCPVNWVLVNGETITGVTLHHMVEKADAGDIVGQREVPIKFTDTAISLYGKLERAAEELLLEMLPLIAAGRAPRVPQDPVEATKFGGRRPEDGRIDWTWTARRIYDLVRAVTEPYPGAFTGLPGGEKMIIWWGLPESSGGREKEDPPGRVEVEEKGVFVRARDGRLSLLDVETGGKRLRGPKLIQYFQGKEGWTLS